MHEIDKNELEMMRGGGLSPWTAVGIGAVIVFIIGVYDGLTRPLSCNK